MLFKKGDYVEKFAGDYRGPGLVHIADLDDNGKPLYVVKFKIEGGSGYFYHIMREQQLKARAPSVQERYAEHTRKAEAWLSNNITTPYCQLCGGPCLQLPTHTDQKREELKEKYGEEVVKKLESGHTIDALQAMAKDVAKGGRLGE